MSVPPLQCLAVSPCGCDCNLSLPSFAVLVTQEVRYGHHKPSHERTSVQPESVLKPNTQITRHATQEGQPGVGKSATHRCMVLLVNEVGDPSDVATNAHRNNERITARKTSLQINPTIIALIIAITNNFKQEYMMSSLVPQIGGVSRSTSLPGATSFCVALPSRSVWCHLFLCRVLQ